MNHQPTGVAASAMQREEWGTVAATIVVQIDTCNGYRLFGKR
jgi:hypothetical protein